ncbi:hypothetical protein BOX15_Mlig003743g1, partial [Macrostomum lignano]
AKLPRTPGISSTRHRDMAAHFAAQVSNQRLQVKETGSRCQVPNDDYAKLMFYLACVEGVKCGDFPAYMTDYSKYRQLTESQKRNIVATARRHDPDEVLCFIEADELPDNHGNKFLQLSAQEENLTAFGIRGAGGAMMGLRRELGDSQNLMKIMAHTKSWASNNYYQPLRRLGGASSTDASQAALLLLMRALRTD